MAKANNVDYEKFFTEYMQAYDNDETMRRLADRLGTSLPIIKHRKAHLKKHGVILPSLVHNNLGLTKRQIKKMQRALNQPSDKKPQLKEPPI